VPICHKCQQNKDENQVRTYHLVLKNNLRPTSLLAGVDKVNLCYSCDGARKTSIGRFLEGQG
jgi:capsule polysaccharide export protein KpsC/LpsZ